MSRPDRFLIVSWDGGGNAPPALNLGARLTNLGHRVRLLGWDSMASRAAAAFRISAILLRLLRHRRLP